MSTHDTAEYLNDSNIGEYLTFTSGDWEIYGQVRDIRTVTTWIADRTVTSDVDTYTKGQTTLYVKIAVGDDEFEIALSDPGAVTVSGVKS